MRNKGKNPSPKLQAKREKLIELSVQAKKLRQQKMDNATTAEEAAFWASRTVNYMLLHHIYTEGGGVRFETFNQWKEEGATIRKGAKATVIWGQLRQGITTQEQADATPNAESTEDTTAAEYNFSRCASSFPRTMCISPTPSRPTTPPPKQSQQSRHRL